MGGCGGHPGVGWWVVFFKFPGEDSVDIAGAEGHWVRHVEVGVV